MGKNLYTHAGIFHADEVMATAILEAVYPESTLKRIFRVSDGVSDDSTAIIYDIGGGEFDHHQKGGGGTRENGVPYSSAGLIWRFYGLSLCSCLQVWEAVDECLIQGIDAIDNGVMPKGERSQALTISEIISSYNPNWDEDIDSDMAFESAVAVAADVLKRQIASAEAKVRCESAVTEAVKAAEGGIMILPQYMPWQDVLLGMAEGNDILYVIFPSNRGGFNVQAVPDAPGSFGMRKALPEAWRGLRDADLAKETGISEAVFCHPAGFIAGAETEEAAIALAREAIKA